MSIFALLGPFVSAAKGKRPVRAILQSRERRKTEG
jgi:hypothetical protein